MEIPAGYQILPANETHVFAIAENNRHSIFEQVGYEMTEEESMLGASTALHYPHSQFFVLVDDQNQVVAQYKRMQVWNDLVARPMIWIERMYVRPEFRTQGFAQLLVDHCLETLTAPQEGQPLPLLISMIERENHKSLELAKKNGFREENYYILFHRDALDDLRAQRKRPSQ